MPKVHVHGNQITLPDELRTVLTTATDDAIEAEEVDDGILLKRSPEARRSAGLADLRAAQAGVRYVGPAPRPNAEEEERKIADLLAADKDDRRRQQGPSLAIPVGSIATGLFAAPTSSATGAVLGRDLIGERVQFLPRQNGNQPKRESLLVVVARIVRSVVIVGEAFLLGNLPFSKNASLKIGDDGVDFVGIQFARCRIEIAARPPCAQRGILIEGRHSGARPAATDRKLEGRSI
jgi:bifunctional DNA-binding transcriptional regulator/antitoxin component of YhaV-PrlF toxin-antitoxin module